MKVRWDFVTNSSSTSFIIICNGKPNLDQFMAAMGVKKRSPLWGLFEVLFCAMTDHLQTVEEAAQSGYAGDPHTVPELIKKYFSEKTAGRVVAALKHNKDVWFGRLNTDETAEEAFFSCDAFEVERGDFYLNALPCVI